MNGSLLLALASNAGRVTTIRVHTLAARAVAMRGLSSIKAIFPNMAPLLTVPRTMSPPLSVDFTISTNPS